jgi:hypothetical protein
MNWFLILAMISTLTLRAGDFNTIVLEQVRSMPVGGGYAITSDAHTALNFAVTMTPEGVKIKADAAMPSYCSGATYLVFLKSLAAAQKRGTLNISEDCWKKLLPSRDPDGVGIWGRWNANGPGTARLFHELRLGRNFTSFEEALPGDFLKIFWTDAVGKKERGHSVVFLGLEKKDGVEHVKFWSSNKPGGYGEKSVPRSKVARTLFSRIENPENTSLVLKIPNRDSYLASLLTTESSFSEALQKTGAR